MDTDKIYELISKLTSEEKIAIYKRLENEIEDSKLLEIAECRVENEKNEDFISEDEILKTFGITKEDLKNIDVEI